jgi:hypothetical protein
MSLQIKLFNKSELDWLLSNKQITKSYEYKIKSTIKKKINKFFNLELPLLIENGLINEQMIRLVLENTPINDNMLPILGKV